MNIDPVVKKRYRVYNDYFSKQTRYLFSVYNNLEKIVKYGNTN